MGSSKIIFLVGYLTLTVFLVVGSLAPFDFVELSWDDAVKEYQTRLSAGIDLTRGRTDLAINFSIAIPLAFCAMGLLESLGLGMILAVCVSLVLGATLALGVEFGQMWLPVRDASLRDIVAQSAGHLVGIAGWLLMRRRVMAWAAALPAQQRVGDRIVWLSYAYLVGVTFYLLLPLDFVSGPGELFRKFKTRQVEMVPFSFPYASRGDALYAYVCDTLRFVPVGLLCAAGWRRRTQRPEIRHNLWEAVLAGVGIVIALEAAQLVIASRYTSITDVIFGAVGIVGGVVLAPWLVRRDGSITADAAQVAEKSSPMRRAAPWLLAAIGYAAVLTSVFWGESEFIQDSQVIRERLVGFYSHAWQNFVGGSDVGNLFGVLKKIAWFVPLGALAGSACFASSRGAKSWRRRLYVMVVAGGCAAVCLAIELGQLPLADHTPSAVDAGLATLSAWTGIGLAAFVWQTAKREKQRRISSEPGRGSATD